MDNSADILFQNYDALSTASFIEDVDLARDFLTEIGIDPNEVATYGIAQGKKYNFLAQAALNQQRDQSLLEKIRESYNEAIQRNAELAGNLLQQIFQKRELSFQFRNIEDWTDDQLRDLLSDADMLKLLEELDKLDEE